MVNRRRRAELNALGFSWEDPRIVRWRTNLRRFRRFQQTKGRFPSPGTTERRSLNHWVASIRHGAISVDAERRTQLDALGFVWSPRDDSWKIAFERFKKFRETAGRIPEPGSREREALGKWMAGIRGGHIALDRKRRTELNALGFSW